MAGVVCVLVVIDSSRWASFYGAATGVAMECGAGARTLLVRKCGGRTAGKHRGVSAFGSASL
jgi:hypothetical protein